MKISIRPPKPPAGLHQMRLNGLREVDGQFGLAYRWDFSVEEGEYKGMEVSKMTGRSPCKGESLANFLAELSGQDLESGKDVDTDKLLGQLFEVVLIERDGQTVSISSVSPVQQEVEATGRKL